MQYIAHKYKLNPTKLQINQLAQMAGNTRWLWNYLLDLNQKQYALDKKFLFRFDMQKLLPVLKQQNIWLKETPSQAKHYNKDVLI